MNTRRSGIGTEIDVELELETAKVRQQVAQLSQARKRLCTLRKQLEQARRHEEVCRTAQQIIQMLAQSVQQHIHSQLASVVSSCLSAVFNRPYTFRLQFLQRRGRTEATLEFDRDGLVLDPMTAAGGGAVDVAAFALRVACLMLASPTRVIVLDEPFRFVSSQYRENVRLMLEELSEQFGLQIVMVTHIDELVTGRVVRLEEQ